MKRGKKYLSLTVAFLFVFTFAAGTLTARADIWWSGTTIISINGVELTAALTLTGDWVNAAVTPTATEWADIVANKTDLSDYTSDNGLPSTKYGYSIECDDANAAEFTLSLTPSQLADLRGCQISYRNGYSYYNTPYSTNINWVGSFIPSDTMIDAVDSKYGNINLTLSGHAMEKGDGIGQSYFGIDFRQNDKQLPLGVDDDYTVIAVDAHLIQSNSATAYLRLNAFAPLPRSWFSGDAVVGMITQNGDYYAYTNAPTAFTDVPSWAKASVDFLNVRGVAKGVSATKFNANTPVKRADFMLMLMRALNLSNVNTKGVTQFADVPKGAYYADALLQAKALGIAKGTTATTFKPDAPVTRQEMATLIDRVMENFGFHPYWEANNTAVTKMTDWKSVADWAQTAVNKVYQNGIMLGRTPTTLAPKANAMRAEAAVIIARMLGVDKLWVDGVVTLYLNGYAIDVPRESRISYSINDNTYGAGINGYGFNFGVTTLPNGMTLDKYIKQMPGTVTDISFGGFVGKKRVYCYDSYIMSTNSYIRICDYYYCLQNGRDLIYIYTIEPDSASIDVDIEAALKTVRVVK